MRVTLVFKAKGWHWNDLGNPKSGMCLLELQCKLILQRFNELIKTMDFWYYVIRADFKKRKFEMVIKKKMIKRLEFLKMEKFAGNIYTKIWLIQSSFNAHLNS